MHLVSCRHRTSGLADLRNFATISMRRRTELIFQVVREKRMGPARREDVRDDARLGPTIKNDFPKHGLERRNRLQPGGIEWSVKSILNMPGSTFFEVSRL